MQHPWLHRSKDEGGYGLGTCAECHQAHCPRQHCAGQRMVEGDVVARKKHGDEQLKWRWKNAACHGTPSPNWLQTDSSDVLLLKPCVPTGTKRIEWVSECPISGRNGLRNSAYDRYWSLIWSRVGSCVFLRCSDQFQQVFAKWSWLLLLVGTSPS